MAITTSRGALSAAVCTLFAASLAAPARAQQGEPKQPAVVPAARLQAMPAPQGKSQEELKQLRAEKLAKPVFEKAAWLTDYDAARKAAKEQQKLLLVYFTRSYAH